MASTRAGAVLTDRHRRRQVRQAIAADSDIRRAWRLLDPSDIDGTRVAWQRQMLTIVRRYHGLSEAEAIRYLSAYRLAEIGTTGGALVVPAMNATVTAGVLDASGPAALKRKIGAGVPPRTAYRDVRQTILAETHKLIMAGGRALMRMSGQADRRAVGYRRVSDGDPCTFCAMLVSRGPAYTSAAKALARGNGDPYHPHCGCTVEIIYSDWQPTEMEQEWVDAYRDAAAQAEAEDGRRTQQTVLWRMRDTGTFRDSPVRRAVAAN